MAIQKTSGLFTREVLKRFSGLPISVLNPTATFADDLNQNSIILKMT
ncbi:MAG: hypothetical protein WCK53_07500 [Methanomicrobiales archaeon]